MNDNNVIENTNIQVNLNDLGRVTSLITSTLDLATLLEIIMDSAKEILNAEASSLLLLDKEKQELNFYIVSSGQQGEMIKEISIPVGQGIAGICAETGESLIVNDAENDPRIFKAVDQKTETITRNLICVPMKVKGELVGVLEAINSKGQDHFTEEELNLLGYIADQAAIAINNSDLFVELAKNRGVLQQRIKELSILYEFNDLLSLAVSVEELTEASVDYITKTIGIRSSLFYVLDSHNQHFALIHSKGVDVDLAQINKLPTNRATSFFKDKFQPVLIKQTDLSKNQFFRQLSLNFPLVVIPVNIDKDLHGVVFLWGIVQSRDFTPFQVRLIRTMSSHLSQAYSSLRLQETLMEQSQIKQELKIAYLLQQRILPVTFEVPEGIDIQGVSLPAEEVGGDFYDFIPIDQQKFALVIADVAGKGIPAALFMALARNTIRTEVQHNPNPKVVIETVNRLLTEDSESGIFVTAAYFLVDTFNKAITYVCAGHNNQLLYRSQKKRVDIIKGMGRPLGVFEDTKFEEKVVFYDEGDLLVLFSDGIVEAEKTNGDQYDEWRFIDFLKKNHQLNSNDFIIAAEEDILEFTEGNPFTDDFTLLVSRL